MTTWSNPHPPVNRVWCSECETRLKEDEVGICGACLEVKRVFWEHCLNLIDGDEDQPATGACKYPQRDA